MPKINTNSPPFNESCKIVGEVNIGAGSWIGYFTLLDGSGGLTIGKNTEIASGTHIYTHDTVRRCVTNQKTDKRGQVNRDLIEKSPVKIGNNVFIGANSTILKGVVIGDAAVIGAGSVVLEGTRIRKNEFWAGNPARKIRKNYLIRSPEPFVSRG